jgi:hypothetical protein
MTQTKEGIQQMYSGMRKIAQNGGYRERKELVQMLYTASWFDNFGYEFYQQRLNIARIAYERGLKNEDIPELLKEELDIEE